MNATPGPVERVVSRRRVLELLGIGVGGAMVASACAGGENARDGDGGDGGGEKVFHGAWPYQVPPKGHFNLLPGITDAILGEDGIYEDLLFVPGGMYLWKEQEWVPMLAESWEFDEQAKTFTVRLASGNTWSDGKPITSKDVLTTFWCRRVMRQVEWEYINGMEATDDRTVVFTMNNPSTVVERYVIRANIFSDAVYGEFAQRAEKLFGSGKDLDSPEGVKLNEELQAFRPEGDQVVTSGPYRYDFDSITNSQLTLVKNDKGYNADKVAFDRLVIYNGETDTISAVVLSGAVDYATHGFAVATEKQFISQGVRILRPPVYSGPALLMNFDRLPEFKDVRVRQALAYAIDREKNGKVSLAESGVPVTFMCGMSDLHVPVWLSSETQDRLERYELDLDRAAALLEEAGWTKRGRSWHKPGGSKASYTITFPSEFADWSAAGQNVASQLSDFGIEVTPRGVTHTQHGVDVNKGRFQLAIRSWGSSTNPHPHFSYSQAYFTENIRLAANEGGRGIGFELKNVETEALGTVDLERITVATGESLDENLQKENIAKAAIAFNELLPKIPLFERYGNNPALEGERVKKWPADEEPIMANAPYADNFTTMLILSGELEPA